MLTRCWLPPESRPTCSADAVAQTGLLEHPLDRRRRVGELLQPREQARFSATESFE